MLVVGAHTHLGPYRVFDLDSNEEEPLKSINTNGVDASLVQPYPGAPSVQEEFTLV